MKIKMKKLVTYGLVIGLSCSTTVFAKPFYVQNMQDQWSVVENGKVTKKVVEKYKKIEVLFPNLLLVQNNKNEIGLVTKDFKEVASIGKYDSIGEWIDGYAIAEKKDEEGYLCYAVLDQNGKEVLPLLKYKEVKRILNNLAISVIDEEQQKVSIYNNKMELLNQIENTTNDFIRKVDDYQYIFVIGKKAYNRQAKEIREIVDDFSYLQVYGCNEIFFVNHVLGGPNYLVDSRTGKEYGEFKEIDLQEKYAMVEDEDGIGIIGAGGKVYVKTGLYDTMKTLTYHDYGYNQQYLCVSKKDKVGIIHYTGKVIVPIGKYKDIIEIVKNAFLVEDYNKNTYYISKNGKKLPHIKGYSYYSFLNKDRAMIGGRALYSAPISVIDTNTNKKLYTVSEKLDERSVKAEDKRIQNAPKGTMIVCDYQDDVVRILNKNGKTIVKKGVFTILDSFDGTYIVDITPKGKYRVITKTGKQVIKPLYDNIENRNGYFYATKGSKTVVFDKKGKVVVKLGNYLDIAQ